jgi:hypothetical protein
MLYTCLLQQAPFRVILPMKQYSAYILWCREDPKAHVTGSWFMRRPCRDKCCFKLFWHCNSTYKLWCWEESTATCHSDEQWGEATTIQHSNNFPFKIILTLRQNLRPLVLTGVAVKSVSIATRILWEGRGTHCSFEMLNQRAGTYTLICCKVVGCKLIAVANYWIDALILTTGFHMEMMLRTKAHTTFDRL